MNAERAEAVEPVRRLRSQKPFTTDTSLQLTPAIEPEPDRVQRLLDLTQRLLREAEILAGEKLFIDESHRLQTLNISEGIDFFGELKQFEISLIKLALAQTGGHQARAAKLLNIKATTLNTKIKLYQIDY